MLYISRCFCHKSKEHRMTYGGHSSKTLGLNIASFCAPEAWNTVIHREYSVRRPHCKTAVPMSQSPSASISLRSIVSLRAIDHLLEDTCYLSLSLYPAKDMKQSQHHSRYCFLQVIGIHLHEGSRAPGSLHIQWAPRLPRKMPVL